MDKNYAKIARLYHVMVELLNAPKTKDVIMKMPSEVKNGKVIDFNGREFGDTDMPDGLIFSKPERVLNCQAVTQALKRDYTKALKEWIDGEASSKDSAPKDKKAKDDVKEPKAKGKKKKDTSRDDEGDTEPEIEFDLVAEIKGLLNAGKVKKAKKLLAKHEGEAGYKKAKKLIKKAGEA